MHAKENGHGNGAGKPGMRAKWRHSRLVLKEGLEAALRASPETIENCKPKTNYGALVRGLILESSKGKATALKTVMTLIDWVGEEEGDEVIPDEAHRDWSPDGVWETMPEAEPPEEEPAEAMEGPAKQEIRRRINRLIEVGDHEHAARIIARLKADADADDLLRAAAAKPP